MYSILTCADTRYFPMARTLARNIQLYPQYRLFLYDLGLEKKERLELETLGVTLECIEHSNDIFDLNSKGLIKTTHKMDCINHFLRKYKEGVVIIDADVLLVEDAIPEIFPEDKEIVVTYRCDREQKMFVLANGKINAGVMGFGVGIREDFFESWKAICAADDHSDQSGISALLSESVALEKVGTSQPFRSYTVRIMDGNLYNDVTTRVGKIFHFKRVGRRLNKRLGFSLFSFIQYHFPHAVAAAVRFNREKRLWVWRGKKDV